MGVSNMVGVSNPTATRACYHLLICLLECRTMVGVVVHCHGMGVLHRDLKPENFLFSDDVSDDIIFDGCSQGDGSMNNDLVTAHASGPKAGELSFLR